MQQYLELMRHVHDHGVHKEDRTGTDTKSVLVIRYTTIYRLAFQ